MDWLHLDLDQMRQLDGPMLWTALGIWGAGWVIKLFILYRSLQSLHQVISSLEEAGDVSRIRLSFHILFFGAPGGLDDDTRKAARKFRLWVSLLFGFLFLTVLALVGWMALAYVLPLAAFLALWAWFAPVPRHVL